MIPKIQLLHPRHILNLTSTSILIGVGLGLLFLGLGIWQLFFRPITWLLPISDTNHFQFLFNPAADGAHAKRVVLGFLPYWSITKFTLQPELTQLAYFSLGISEDGSVQTKDASGNTEQGYLKMGSDQVLGSFNQEKQQGGQNILTFTQFDNTEIVNFLASPTAHQKFMSSVDAALDAYPLDGINIDIEYTGDVTDQLRHNLVNLMTELRQHLNQRKVHPQISIDMYVNAPSKNDIWDVPAIQQQVDYVVVMAYDFHYTASSTAGPVAPLFGGKKLWDSDITQNLKDFLAEVPNQKILLGIPFYGYEWQTTSTDSQATTFPDTGATATLLRVQNLLNQKDQLGIHEYWNEDALSPYLSFQKNGQTHIIYYEDSRSISYKLDLVNQLNLGGIAIWSLGYEGNSRDLWDVIHRKL